MFKMNKAAGKKGVKLCAALLTAVIMITGCSSGSGGSSEGNWVSIEDRYTVDPEKPAWQLDKKEEVTDLTWYVNADWWNTDFGKDIVTKKIKEDLNINIKFITGDDTKLNTFFAGGDMPDLLTVFDSNSPVVQKAATWAMPLNDLAEKYDPYFNKVAAADTLNWFQLADGKTYGYPNYSNTQADYDSGNIPAKTAFIIRKDVYEAIGSPVMGTPEEFESVMKQIKEKFPTLIPFGFNSIGEGTGSLGDVLQDFIGVPLETANGEFYDRNQDEDYLTWLKTLNKVYRDGNISDDSFADDGTAFEEKVKSGKYATMLLDGTPQQGGNLQIYLSANEGKEYVAIDGPQSTKGNAPTLNQSGITGWMINFISKDAKDPAKAIQIYTYLLSEEGQLLMNYGIEGETYQKNADGTVELLPAVKDLQLHNADKFKKEYRMGEFMFFGHDRHKALSADAFPEAIKQMQEWGKGKLKPHFILENISPNQGTPEARALSAINAKWNSTLVSMVRAKDDASFDNALAAYKSFLGDNRWDDIVKVRSEKMKLNKEKLGIQ
ncbi:sugar ABC transporter substrate-binding protein [Paenibacillus sp. UMB7766-LJ446]|uniref:sugar ABC transporter substrate-binding protein n=1 Tax=unclassified Paenibacillus TaxID=185978 RepID=UPI0009A27876|nr:MULTISPECIES: sugar ABC transporter substrate-binding protein [unclassified Paenibacillus]MDK8190947.1 sugar ABC transporter substrate-binding protein [Paenibacillus sp. UMB7766-LJ446]MDN8589206.1 sugar ABC transporter substrate-binding protein [Paenibacillus sp. 11B]OPG99892.1 sugar ABC transporter substrate-binding protein [Chryseobacterium mucoviscidosis]